MDRGAKPRSSTGSRSPLIEPKVEPRQLKTLADLAVEQVEIGNANARDGGMSIPARRGLRDLTNGHVPTSDGAPPTRVGLAAYSVQDLETLAVDVLRLALTQPGTTDLEDVRRLRGIGGDVVDQRGRVFELKASAGEVPNEISLTANEAERAARVGKDFFLVVVAGLERGYETTVRIIADPLRSLDWRPNAHVTLTGIRSKRAALIKVGEVSAS